MKKVMMIILGLFLTSCGGMQVKVPTPEAPEPYLGCTIMPVEGGQLLSCADGSEGFIADGSDGTNGQDGQDAPIGQLPLFVGFIDPCGKQTTHDELLYIDRFGNFHAWFKNVGHVILNEGTLYQTTDGTSCKFKIVDGTLIDNL